MPKERSNLSRVLGGDEVRRLVASSEYAKKEAELSRAASRTWPGEYNIQLLAEAVSNRRRFVEFDNKKRFTIKYESKLEVVFIKPVSGFVPCGYFSFKKLREALETNTEEG